MLHSVNNPRTAIKAVLYTIWEEKLNDSGQH